MNKKLDVTLPDDVVAVIEGAVAAGQFGTSDEMLADAVHAWTRHQEDRANTIAFMRERIRQSLDDPRPSVPIDEAFERISARVDALFEDR
ncbi:hypothetical protein DEVEQU_03677 [Devosia equisanguinis]|uniref:Type II toxin-antitoxin system ParD family antitoxin n=1 Tax=Devosia equisanguinis TaxID=2490941 RepID=A0A3S4DSU2_9HYPH|nr:type II toxin-antitoxin system ParD family antitoxin [Devosia equisanguinis]VDS06513.1 hypothetical protein DEVEQU_03677 [Devosia equisanguinis]